MLTIISFRPALRLLVIACGVIGAFIIVGLISIPINSTAVLAEIKTILDRDVAPLSRIEGQASLHLLPKPTIEISAVTVSFQNKIELSSPRISFGLRLFSLLSGRYEPVSLEVEAPRVSVPPVLVPLNARELTPLLTTELNKPTEHHRQIEVITVYGGTFEILDSPTETLNASDLKANFYFSSDGAKSVNASGIWRQQNVSLTVSLGRPNQTQDDARSLSLDLSSPSANIWLKGVAFAGGQPQFDGKILVTTPRLDRLSEWLTVSPPINVSTALTLDGTAHLTPTLLSISGANVKLGSVDMSGSVSFDISGPRALVAGTLSAGDMDVTSFLTPIWPKQPNASTWKLTPVDLELTPQQDLDIRLSAERVNLGIVRISNVALSIMAKNRTLDVTLASAKLFQGSAKGKLSVYPYGQGFSVTTRGTFETIDIGQSTLALMDIRRVEGTASGKFSFDANGASLDQWMKSLSGSTDMTISNGTMTGINIASVLKRIETRPLSVIREMRGGKTDFEAMRISAELTNGKAKLNDTTMKLSPNQMNLSGSINIGERSLNLNGEASAPAPANGADPAILAYTVTGSFDDPVVTPDINRILKRSTTVPAPAE